MTHHPGSMIWAQIPHSMFKEALKNSEYVLDVGCGTAGNSIDLAYDGKRVIGIDGNPAAIDVANLKLENLHRSNEEFKRLIENKAFEYGKEHFMSYHFETGYYSESPGDIPEHDEYTGRLPIMEKPLSLELRCQKRLKDITGIDTVICLNTIHALTAENNNPLIEQMIDILPIGGTIIATYITTISQHKDNINVSEEGVDFESRDTIPFSSIMENLGIEYQENISSEIQPNISRHIMSFIFRGQPIWQIDLQQSMFIGKKISDRNHSIKEIIRKIKRNH